jgi:16S rRNA (cytosine1402-N4)-methyltransferase
MHHHDQSNVHIPVLLEPVLQYLDPQAGESYLDLTAGYGGHAAAVLARTDNPTHTVLVDRDASAIGALQEKFADSGARIIHMDFLSAGRTLAAEGRRFDMILADLGVSSPHLNETARGFAFASDGPLDMRMDQSQELTAATIVNRYPVAELADILARYGEEPKAKRIARLIAEHRPIATTTELARVVARAWPGHSKVHPATRTFQAIRIAVNDELAQLAQSLPVWIDLLAPRGRLAVISFHSLEDRLVKQAFAEVTGERYDAQLTLLTKHPVTASETEIVFNPRARSAKLRAAAKINT